MAVCIFVAVICIAALLVLIEIGRELHSFQVVNYEIHSDKLKGIGAPKRVLFLSDMHNQMYGKNNRKLIEAIRECSPDLILIGGDMLVAKTGHPYQNARSFVAQIAGICPVYYANGNHEQRMKERPEDYDMSYQEYKDALVDAGVRFLENASEEVKLGECKVRISGLEISRIYYTHWKRVRMDTEEIEACIGKAQGSVYQILLAHNPVFVPEYLQWGADLVLSGHLHGGVVRIPKLGGVVSPGFEFFPKYSGDHYREGGRDIVVSKGLGVHTIYVRLFNPAELIVLNLSCENE